MWFFKEGYWKIALVASAIVVASFVYFELGIWSPEVKPVPKVETVIAQEECTTWQMPEDTNGLSGSIETCLPSNRETYRLYIGNGIIIEEVYLNGVLQSKCLKPDLRKPLKRPKKPETVKTMYREDM